MAIIDTPTDATTFDSGESGATFANVYELTAGKDGYNNNEWMIDSIHLKPEALNALMKTL